MDPIEVKPPKLGKVIWITGLSGAGKTTLSEQLISDLRRRGDFIIGLDGDKVRSIISRDLDYSVESRIEQITRMRNLAKILYDNGLTVVVSALYSSDDLLSKNRLTFSNYFEVYLNVSIETLIKRDPKGIYNKYRKGKMTNVVGMDIEWQVPRKPDLIFENDIFRECEIMSEEIINMVKNQD